MKNVYKKVILSLILVGIGVVECSGAFRQGAARVLRGLQGSRAAQTLKEVGASSLASASRFAAQNPGAVATGGALIGVTGLAGYKAAEKRKEEFKATEKSKEKEEFKDRERQIFEQFERTINLVNSERDEWIKRLEA